MIGARFLIGDHPPGLRSVMSQWSCCSRLLWPHGPDRNRRVLHYLVGNATDLKLASPSLRRHNDHIYVFLLSRLQDFLGGITYQDQFMKHRTPCQVSPANLLHCLLGLRNLPFSNLRRVSRIQFGVICWCFVVTFSPLFAELFWGWLVSFGVYSFSTVK